MKVNQDNFKRAVKRLEYSLKENNIHLSHSKILDITAKTFGFKNYNEFKNTKYNENTYKIMLTFSDVNYIPMYIHQFENFFPDIKDFIYRTTDNRLTFNVSDIVNNDDDFEKIKIRFFLIASFFPTILEKESFSESINRERNIEHKNQMYSNETFIYPKIKKEELISFFEKNLDIPKEDIQSLLSNAYNIKEKCNMDISTPLLKSLISDDAPMAYGNLIQFHKYSDTKKIIKFLNNFMSENKKNKINMSNKLKKILQEFKNRQKLEGETDFTYNISEDVANELKAIAKKVDNYQYKLDGNLFQIEEKYSALRIVFIKDDKISIMGIPAALPTLPTFC